MSSNVDFKHEEEKRSVAEKMKSEKIFEEGLKNLRKAMGKRMDYKTGNVKKDDKEGHKEAQNSNDFELIFYNEFNYILKEEEGQEKMNKRYNKSVNSLNFQIELKRISSLLRRELVKKFNLKRNSDYMILDFHVYEKMVYTNNERTKKGLYNMLYVVVYNEKDRRWYIYNYKNLEENMTNFIFTDYEGQKIKEKKKVLITKKTLNFNSLKEVLLFFANKAHKEMKKDDYKEAENIIKERLKAAGNIDRITVNRKKAGKFYKGFMGSIKCFVKF